MPSARRWLNPTVSDGAWVLVVALVAATAFGVYRAARDGRFRGTHHVRGAGPDPDPATEPQRPRSVLHDTDVDHELGARATLLQFSSAFCAPCRVTRRTLHEVAGIVPGVVHVEVDAEHHLELVRRLGVTRTPTTLVLDEHGQEVERASGAPKRDEVLATLGRVIVE
jgi:thiol-disulfide isomerase/thioredoxin